MRLGHLPQAEHFGRDFFGKARYVAAFAWQYGSRAVLMKNDVHDGARMEREAEIGPVGAGAGVGRPRGGACNGGRNGIGRSAGGAGMVQFARSGDRKCAN
jgi:hypothetical protein